MRRAAAPARQSLAVFSTACSGLLVGTISGLTFLPAARRVDHGGHQLLVVGVQSSGPIGKIGALRLDFGRHHDDVGRLRVGLGQRLFQHEQVVRRADRHQLAVRLGQARAFAA